MTGWMVKSSILAAGASVSSLLAAIGGGWSVAAALLVWNRLAGIGAAAAMGVGVSLYLGRQHHPSHASSMCNVDEVFNCDVINTSAYSELGGIPIAFLGTAFYFGCLVLVAQAGRSREAYARAGHVVAAGSALSVLYSVFLAYQSTLLGAWCLFCISLYGLNLVLLVGGLWMVQDSGASFGAGVMEAVKGMGDRSLATITISGAVALVLSMGWYGGLGPVPATSTGGTNAAEVNVAALVEGLAPGAAMDGTEPVYGDPSAPYTVLEWADFECPHCGIVAPELKQLANDHPEIRVVFRNYPLDMACNPNIQREFHKNSCTAAYAAECAQQQGKFWELTGLMFKNQSYLDRAGIETMAEQKGLDVASLGTCMEDPATKAAVKADLEAGESAGVTGTPALFLLGAHGDGTWVKLRASPEQISAIVDAHKAAGAPLPVGG
ncbi:MAG: hypothetical protein CL927_12020 [Deltaproteobacteria bacterium]|nr:hypothetical protein [Deltaproteobacteria bacterium]HCH66017.1 hypothetical protein [Deltaproteobacteria bacterium]